jgi:hypothetical protein
MKMEIFNQLRDCIREVFINGISLQHINRNEQAEKKLVKQIQNDVFQKFVHGLVAETLRLGCTELEIKDILIDWNRKSKHPLSLGDENRRLLRYVDWCVSTNKCKTGCNALSDICIGQDKCHFYQAQVYRIRKEIQNLPFKIEELENYLKVRYENKSMFLITIIRTLRRIQVEKTTGEIIFIGFKGLASNIRDTNGFNFDPMQVCRFINILIDERVIEKTVTGKRGLFSYQANGYKFLPWKPP